MNNSRNKYTGVDLTFDLGGIVSAWSKLTTSSTLFTYWKSYEPYQIQENMTTTIFMPSALDASL